MATPGGQPAPPLTTDALAPRPAAGQQAPAPSAAPARGGPGRPTPDAQRGQSVAERLFTDGFAFDFFQAVRLLERLDRARKPVGRAGPPRDEVVRFLAHLSLSFPPSSIYEIEPAGTSRPMPAMTVTFLGLTGPSGVLPRHYTEMLLHLERDAKGPEKRALRAWLDLFNHRLLSLFYRAWEKYRFFVPYERGDFARPDAADPFTQALFSLVGLGVPPLRNRLRVSVREDRDGERRERSLARLNDLVLLYYGGFFAHRPRNVSSLRALVADYFGLPVRVEQFRGQWLRLDPANQSRLGGEGNNQMGVNLVAGARVWSVESKFRLRVGPLRYPQFLEFLPDRSPVAARKTFFLLCHLVRMYVGPELDFDVQLVLAREDVPECRLGDDGGPGPRLGWNTWVRTAAYPHDAEDATFAGEEVVWLGPPANGTPL
jgi:type VI secretion system protein ImpH